MESRIGLLDERHNGHNIVVRHKRDNKITPATIYNVEAPA